MKRRDFLKGLVAVPAAMALPITIKAKEEEWYSAFYINGNFDDSPIIYQDGNIQEFLFTKDVKVSLIGGYENQDEIAWSVYDINTNEKVAAGKLHNEKYFEFNVDVPRSVRITVIAEGVQYQYIDVFVGPTNYAQNEIMLAGIIDDGYYPTGKNKKPVNNLKDVKI